MNRLPPGTTIRIVASAKAGHVVPCVGLAHALGVEPQISPVQPRKFFAALAPWGPADPRDRSAAAPFPDIAIASARETVPYLRKVKRLAGDQVFTIFLGDPRTGHNGFDLIWTPGHDSISGANIIKTLTSPHPHDAAALALARANPDPRLAALPSPRVACLIGGPSGQFAFGPDDIAKTCKAIADLLDQGASLMISPSRRTPAAVTKTIRTLAEQQPGRTFVWDGTSDNPYRPMLALADAFLVTADSTNMIGEALAAGKPVHVLQLAGHPGKLAYFHDQLRQRGLIHNWNGALQQSSNPPIDATPEIAMEVLTRYQAFKARADIPVR